MSLAVTQRPSVAYSGETIRWSAVGNPILYKMQRSDFSFNQVNNAGGFAQLQFNAVDRTGSFAIGDIVYIFVAGQYDGYGTVTAEAFAGNTLITTSIPYAGANPGFVNNNTLRSAYRVEVELYDGITNTIIGVTNVYSPTLGGILTINISGILAITLRHDIDADITTVTSVFDDMPAYKNFYIKYREVWTSSAEAQTNDNANKFYAINGARQIPSINGGFLSEYVSFQDGAPSAKFLNTLTRPKVWRGYPFLISVISGDNLTTASLLNITYRDYAGGFISVANSTIIGWVGNLLIYNIPNILAIPDNATTVELRFYRQTPDTVISEVLICDIVDPCENSIMLLGRNHLGGVMQWLFDFDQEYSNTVQDTFAKRLSLITESLSLNEWETLQDFITLGEVYKNNITELTSSINKTSSRIDKQVYVIDSAGNKVGVIVIPTKNSTRTKRSIHNLELVIEYPERQNA